MPLLTRRPARGRVSKGKVRYYSTDQFSETCKMLLEKSSNATESGLYPVEVRRPQVAPLVQCWGLLSIIIIIIIPLCISILA